MKVVPSKISKGFWIWLISTSSLCAAPPPDYYSTATGQTGGNLKQALREIISDHTIIEYSNLIQPLIEIWRDPENTANLQLVYSSTSVAINSSWNREHLWPRSRGNSDQLGPDDSDLFHVWPSDIGVNAERGSLYFDESDPGDPQYLLPAHPLAPQTSLDSDSFQPPPQQRGDIARALFYMDVRYDGQEPLTTDFELVSFPPGGSQMGKLNTLLLWHAQDPPDDAERARNDLIFTNYQHNRNPFIDHPEWVTDIWGTGSNEGGGSRPIARAGTLVASAVESPPSPGSFLVSLNQFAGVGGITVDFTMTGTADSDEYTLSGAGVTYDPETGLGSVLIPENFSSVIVTLSPTPDGETELPENAVLSLVDGVNYTVVPGVTATATLVITDSPGLPASWNFDSGLPYPNPLFSNIGSGRISFSGWLGTINSFGGSSGSSLALVGNAGNGSWIDIHLSMTGYTNLQLSFQTRGTASGYDTGIWSASVDGGNFTTLAGVNTATRNTVFSPRQVSFSSITELTNAPEVTLRYTLSGATSSSANNRIDELQISATPIVTGDGLRTVSIAAVDSSANEVTLDPGTFSLQLNGFPPAEGLEVSLFFGGGTATPPGVPGADFELEGLASYDPITRSGTVFFAEGQIVTFINVIPLADDETESAETVVARIEASPHYISETNNSATITILSPLANDAFAHAAPLTGDAAIAMGSNVGASRETNEPWHHQSLQTGGRSVWWKWTASADGILKIATQGSNFDTMLGVYTGANVGSLLRLAVDDDGGVGLDSLIHIRVSQGETYFIAVDGYGQSAGQIVLAANYSAFPTVAIDALFPLMKERGGVNGTVVFTLAQASPLPIVLNLTFEGTASAGTDYSVPANNYSTFTVPAGVTSAFLNLFPIADDNPVEGTETISVTLQNGGTYQTESPPANTATLTLEDDSPYSPAWLSAHSALNAENSSPLGDPDGDGVPTLLEFLAGRNPLVADASPILTIELLPFSDPVDGQENIHAWFRCIRRRDAGLLPLALEGSDTLAAGSWTTRGILVSVTPLEETDYEEVLFRSSDPVSTPGSLPATWFRLRVETP